MEQFKYFSLNRKDMRLEDILLVTGLGATRILDDAAGLQQQLCIIAHNSPGGPRGVNSTKSFLESAYHYSTLSSYITALVKSCLYCLSTSEDKKVACSFASAVQGAVAKKLLQFNYVETAFEFLQ